jgi:anthranilate synthase component 2/para-aminobenzoate synthetase component 2
MIVIIDNEDSFVETLARYVREAGHETRILPQAATCVADVEALSPRGVILSPGPYAPAQAPLCLALPKAMPHLPILGVCLGHLAIAEAYGGRTVGAAEPVHGRASHVRHEGDRLFSGLPNPFAAGRYHALVAHVRGTVLQPTAWSEDGELMAFRHPGRPHYGVQFHPESVLTLDGRTLLGNFLGMLT